MNHDFHPTTRKVVPFEKQNGILLQSVVSNIALKFDWSF